MKKRFFILCGLLCGLLLLVSLSSSFSLQKVAVRPQLCNVNLTNDDKETIKNDTKNMSEEHIIQYCIRYTAQKLTFSKHNQLSKGKANCVGYSQYGCKVLNYAFKVNNIKNKAIPVVGTVHYMGINLNNILKKIYSNPNFVKDHDFIELNQYYVDPCLYDLLDTSCATCK